SMEATKDARDFSKASFQVELLRVTDPRAALRPAVVLAKRSLRQSSPPGRVQGWVHGSAARLALSSKSGISAWSTLRCWSLSDPGQSVPNAAWRQPVREYVQGTPECFCRLWESHQSFAPGGQPTARLATRESSGKPS